MRMRGGRIVAARGALLARLSGASMEPLAFLCEFVKNKHCGKLVR